MIRALDDLGIMAALATCIREHGGDPDTNEANAMFALRDLEAAIDSYARVEEMKHPLCAACAADLDEH